MKRDFIKKVSFVIVATSIATTMVACSKKETATTDSTKPSSTKEVVKPTTIKILTDTFLTEEAGRADIVAEYKKLTGIDLQITQPAHNQYYEKVNLAFASNDIPDVVEIGGTNYLSYAVNGALLDVTKLADQSTVLKGVDKKYVDSLKINGKLYGYPMTRGNGPITYVRQDWLDKVSLKAPTNYDEFIKMLKAFKTVQADAIPYTAPGLVGDEVPSSNYTIEFYQDASPDFIQKNGKWVDGMAQTEMKAALKRMADAYKEGLIDKEIVTNKTSTCRDKFYAGKVGTFTYWAGGWNKTLQDNIAKTVKDAVVSPIPAIKETKYIERTSLPLAITTKAQNPEGIFKYLIEYMHDGGEGQTLFTYGIKDVTYKITDGKMTMLPSKNDPKVLFGKVYFSPELSMNKWSDPYEQPANVKNSLEMFDKNSYVAPLPPASEALSKNNADLLNIKKQIISKIVFGELSIDDGLAKYTKDSKALVDEILADLNKSK